MNDKDKVKVNRLKLRLKFRVWAWVRVRVRVSKFDQKRFVKSLRRPKGIGSTWGIVRELSVIS